MSQNFVWFHFCLWYTIKVEKIDLNKLNSEQLNALYQTEGPVLVTAGAGSGKTRLLTYRIAYLIQEKDVPASNILAITFTNKAAKEMLTRLSDMVEDADKIWVSTFHSMCAKILRMNISNLRKLKKNVAQQINFDANFSIYSETDKEKALKEVIAKNNIEQDDILKKVGWHISNAKNNNLNPWDYQRLNSETKDIDVITKIYAAYQAYLANNNAIDFDDLLTKTYELFINFPDILDRYQNKFQYIHVDEFQDTNTIQYDIVKLLASKYKNIFVVGDEDQCIYGWRGANIQNILSFKRDFEGCRAFKLEQNYRSTKQILGAANNLIRNNFARNEKTLWTNNQEGVSVEVYKARSEYDEAEYVATTIKRLVDSGEFQYKDIAVLMRLNSTSAAIEEKFLNYNIPYQMFGGFKFFERVEIKNIIAYLRLFANPLDTSSLMKVINFPKRGIGEATINNLFEIADMQGVTPLTLIVNHEEYMLDNGFAKKLQVFKDVYVDLLEHFNTLKPVDFIEYLVKRIDLKQEYKDNSEESISKLLNVDNFVAMAQEYFKNNPNTSISEFLQSITLIADIDSYEEENNKAIIATVHSVKGLEFKVVFAIGLEEGVFPIIRAGTTNTDLEEERRLMYVAITRAEERLYVSSAATRIMYGNKNFQQDSRFIEEAGIAKKKEVPTYVTQTFAQAFQPKKQSFSLGGSFGKPNKNEKSMDLSKYAVGKKVTHPKFGEGVIVNTDALEGAKCIAIDFKNFGQKNLSVEYAPITVID